MTSATRDHVPHPLRPYPPLIVNAALTGMVPRRSRVPHVPVTAEQIADDAEACFAAGATIVHLHARDDDEAPDWRREAYEAFVPEVRRRCPGVVVCVTTSGRAFNVFEKRRDVLGLEGDAKPDMASLTLGSLNFRDTASVNDPDMLVRALPAGTVWAAAGIGAFQLAMNAIAIFMGGHVRTGLEDNPHLDVRDRTPATNEALVERIGRLAELAGRALATVLETRAMLGLECRVAGPAV